MIEAIVKVPDNILKGQQSDKPSKTKFIVIFLDKKFNCNKTLEGSLEDIKNSHTNLSAEEIKLISDFNYYLGINHAFDKYGNKGYGGQFGLYTCSLLHYNFAEKTFESLFKNKDKKKIETTKTALEKDQSVPEDLKELFLSILQKFFYDTIIQENLKKQKELNLNFSDKKGCKLIFIPPDKHLIQTYNEFQENYLFEQFMKNLFIEKVGKYKFPIDFHETPQVESLSIIYSKFGKQNIVYQDETCNLFTKTEFEKLNNFRKIMKKRNILPLPMFNVPDDSNIYSICFAKKSLLQKLKYIFEETEDKPFNYLLITNFDGFRFERVYHFGFNIDSLINKSIYELKFNNLKNKKNEIKTIQNKSRTHDKFELLYDIAFIFWNKKEESILDEKSVNTQEISFFSPQIKNNSFLDQLLKENSESIISQIYKQDNSFIKFRLLNLISRVLNGTFRVKELKDRYKFVEQMRKLLLIYFKYEESGIMASKIKEIEDKLDEFVKSDSLTEIENDETALYLAGQIVNYLLSNTSYGGTKLELMTKYLLSVNSTEQLKQKICELTNKYSHNEYNTYDTARWQITNKRFLEYEFKEPNFKQNLIPFFTGFYANNIFLAKSEKDEKGGQ